MKFNYRCYNGGKLHKFEPRYDELPNEMGPTKMKGDSMSALRELLLRRVYVKDVCVWCGKEISK